MKENIIRLIENIHMSDTFIVDLQSNKNYDYGYFFQSCIQLADKLNEYSDCKRVVAILDNRIELVQLYFAGILVNKQIIVIDPLKSKDEILEILCEIPEALFISQYEDINLSQFINISGEVINGFYNLSVNTDIKNVLLQKIEKRDFADNYLVTFTSGTSGQTKGVSHSIDNLLSTAYALQEKLKYKDNSCFLHVMPMTYMAGILNSIFFPFICKMKIILSERFSVKVAIRFWNIVAKNNITVFWLSPAMLLMIEQMDRKNQGELFCKEHEMLFLIGTAALTDKIRQKFEDRYGVKLYASYGLSETLFISVETPNSKHTCEIGNVGEILQGVNWKVEEDGELLFSVPWMLLEYTNTDIEEYLAEGFYRTGDIGEIDGNVLKITGRKKDLIIKGGLNISPAKIEKILNDINEVQEAVVVGVGNDYGEELVYCVYTVDFHYDYTEKQLETIMNALVENKLGKNYHIDLFVRLNELPRNINGKIDKVKLRTQLRDKNDN